MGSYDRAVVNFSFAGWMILGRLICQFYSCGHASNLPSVGPPNSTTQKGPSWWGSNVCCLTVIEAIHRANRKFCSGQGPVVWALDWWSLGSRFQPYHTSTPFVCVLEWEFIAYLVPFYRGWKKWILERNGPWHARRIIQTGMCKRRSKPPTIKKKKYTSGVWPKGWDRKMSTPVVSL